MSAKGVNQYRDNVHTEFTALEQWQREVSLFGSLKRLRTFHQYKLWKGFRQAITDVSEWLLPLPGTCQLFHTISETCMPFFCACHAQIVMQLVHDYQVLACHAGLGGTMFARQRPPGLVLLCNITSLWPIWSYRCLSDLPS